MRPGRTGIYWGNLGGRIRIAACVLTSLVTVSACAGRVDDALGNLRSTDAETRRHAAAVLADETDPRAVEGLVGALADPDAGVRKEAAGALGRMRAPSAVDGLIPLLKNSDDSVAGSACRALREIHDPRSFDAVQMLVVHRSPRLRQEAVLTLSALDAARAVPVLVTLLGDSDEEVVTEARISLERAGKASVELLIGLLGDEKSDPGARIQAAMALGELRDPRALRPLIHHLANGLTFLAGEAENATVKFGGLAVPPLLAELERVSRIGGNDSHNNFVRLDFSERIPKMLGHIGEAAVPALVEALHSRDSYVREAVAKALGVSRDKRGVGPLISVAQHDPVEWVRAKAIAALGEIADPRAVEPLLEMLRERTTVWPVAAALAEIESPDAERALVDALRRRDWLVISAAHRLFLRRGEVGSDDLLIQALNREGNSTVASAFINSDNQRLADAARAWAKKHGYEIWNVPSGPKVLKWGGGR